MTLSIDELPVPRAVGDPAWAGFAATIDVNIACQTTAYRTADVTMTAEERLPLWQDEHEEYRLFAAHLDGRIVGRLTTNRQRDDDSTAWIELEVLPDEQGHGVGAALHERLERWARESGAHKLIVYAPSPDGPGGRLVPPTGAGSVPRDNREVRFLLDRGWRLEQVERASRYSLPARRAELERLSDEALAAAAGYRVHVWSGVTPEPWRDDMAALFVRMSTDAPTAGLEEPEEAWTAERVAQFEQHQLDGPSDLLTAAAEDLASGELAGYTRLRVPHDPAMAVAQWDTIVLREHRGHRLGMLLKTANLIALDERASGHPSVITWNAEENRHMLDVNERIGFVPMGYEGAWRRDI